jgi:hypothetical protein
MNLHAKHSQIHVPGQPVSYLAITCIDESNKTIMLHFTEKTTQQTNRKSKSKLSWLVSDN